MTHQDLYFSFYEYHRYNCLKQLSSFSSQWWIQMWCKNRALPLFVFSDPLSDSSCIYNPSPPQLLSPLIEGCVEGPWCCYVWDSEFLQNQEISDPVYLGWVASFIFTFQGHSHDKPHCSLPRYHLYCDQLLEKMWTKGDFHRHFQICRKPKYR